MTDLPSKTKLYKAIEICARDMGKSGEVTKFRSGPFHVMLDLGTGQVRVRVVLDAITDQDIKVVKGACVPTFICTKKIWCRKEGRWIEKRTIL